MKEFVNALPGHKISQKWLNKIGIVAVVSLLLTACSKKNDIVAPGGLRPATLATTIPGDGNWYAIAGPTGTGGYIKLDISGTDSLYSVKDFKQTYTGAPGQPPSGSFYWSFTDNEATGANAPANIHFSGIATGDIKTYNSSDSLKYVNTSFNSVTASSWSTALIPDNNTIGMNQVTAEDEDDIPDFVKAYANGKGWYNYNWDNHTVAPVSGRVLLYKKASTGKIYKFQFSSMYQGGGSSGSFPYFWFTYKALN